MKYFFLFIVFCAYSSFSFSSSAGDAQHEYWHSLIENERIEGIAVAFRDGLYLWPEISLTNSVSYTERDALWYENARILFNKLVEQEQQLYGSSEKFNDQLCSDYILISKELVRSGGSMNYLLSDSATRMVYRALSSYLVNKPSQWSNVVSLVDSKPLSFNRDFIIQFLELDVGNASLVKQISDTPDSQLFFAVCQSLVTNGTGSFLSVPEESKTTTSLMESGDLGLLFQRIGESAVIGQVCLPGFSYFLSKGGNIADVRIDDMTRFKEVLGGRCSKFKSEILMVEYLWPSHLMFVIDIQNPKSLSSNFFETALH